jgi:hypothetical protein
MSEAEIRYLTREGALTMGAWQGGLCERRSKILDIKALN